MTSADALALVGATGGAGTTRLTVEFGATLARAGRDVALLDAAYATQGLARHVPGRIDPDVTALVTDDADADLAAGLLDHPADLPGRLAVCPARAPFERLARAKHRSAAERFEDLLATAAGRFEHVLVDVPPVADNQAVAAVTASDRVALVAPATERGADRLPTARDRLRDLGTGADAVIANRAGGDGPFDGADARIPESEHTAIADLPACGDPDPEFAPAVADAVAVALGLDESLGLSFPEAGWL
ncbi:MAG: ParA family protein [Haloarculaceae archaeon]